MNGITACLLATVFCSGQVLADSVERHWEFDSAKVIFAHGDSVRILGDDSSSVRVTLSQSHPLLPEDSFTIVLSGDTLKMGFRYASWNNKLTIRVPRIRQLLHVGLSIEDYGELQNISASNLSAGSWRGGLVVDSCSLDSLLFDAGEGACFVTSSKIEYSARVICENPIQLHLDRPPSKYLECFTESLTIEIDSTGPGFVFEMPKDNRSKNCTPDRPFPCDSIVRRPGWPRSDSLDVYCRSTVGVGGACIFIGADVCYFDFLVAGK